VYGTTWADIAGGQLSLQLDDQKMREFLLTHTTIHLDDLDTELIKVASNTDTFSIDLPIFVKLLRDFAFNESDALQFFINVSDGNAFSAEDCRSGLLGVQENLEAAWPQATQDKIFDSIMSDAGVRIDMENWMRYCSRLGRVTRLMRYLRM